jgi:hypothetical protein
MARRPAIAVLVGVGLVVAVAFLAGFAEDDPPGDTAPVVVCIDSTVSTDEVRGSYLPDLEALARQVAARQGRFYAAACGANATGSVNWPVHEHFVTRGDYSDGPLREQVTNQVKGIVEGSGDSEGLEDLIATSSTLEGTPLGEMLAVTARQCAHVGPECLVYIFTDGEWADRLLRVRDGVSHSEEAAYVDAYASRLEGLAEAKVNFIGVGYGTNLGEVRLSQARDVAAALVETADGEMGDWTVRLF